jgi:MFS superfamily sulfate permease-like transporter
MSFSSVVSTSVVLLAAVIFKGLLLKIPMAKLVSIFFLLKIVL